MPTSTSAGVVTSVEIGCLWLVGSDGRSYGTAGEGAIAGTTTHARVMRHVRAAQVPAPQRAIIPTGFGSSWRGQVMLGLSDFGSFPMTAAAIDDTLWSVITGATTDTTTNSRWRRFAANYGQTVLPQVGMILSAIYQSYEDGADGPLYYINYVIPRCQVQPSFAPALFQAAGEVTYQVVPTNATIEPTGRLISASSMNQRRNTVPIYAIVAPKPLSLTTFISDGTDVDFTLGYKPTSSIVTLNAAANEFARNGTLVALSSVNTSTGVATMANAGSAGNVNIVLYETDFEAVA